MKRKNPLVVVGAWLALALAPHHTAQGAEAALPTGTITGRVQNVVTGRFLENARLSVKGTGLAVMTDDAGRYVLANVPSGPAVLEVFFTGLDPQQIPLTLAAGQSVVQDVRLTNFARYGDREVVSLDPFLVPSSRMTEGEELAINEQRHAANIKNVVSTDSMDEVMGGNIGEFLKYLPGVATTGGVFEPDEIYIRGFPSRLTAVTSDGAPLANANGRSRAFNLDAVSINNVSRVEVTKVPTPATPADTMAGSVNMVSKSAFERARAEFRYNVSFTSNSESFTFEKKPDPYKTDGTYRGINPSFNFDYTLPIGKNFGLVLAGRHYQQYIATNFAIFTYQAAGANTGASIDRPYLQQFQLVDSPQYRNRESLSLKADWRVSPQLVLSLGVQTNYFMLVNHGNNSFTVNAREADFSGFLPLGINWGLTYAKRPFIVIAKWNHRSNEKSGTFAAFGPDAYLYNKAQTTMDLNVDYQLRRNLTLFANCRNVFNLPVYRERYGSQTPDYASKFELRAYGAIISVGVKGSF